MKLEKIFNKIFSLLCDNVLIYTALLITAVMYYYNSNIVLIWFLVSLIAVRIIFFVFDFITRHKYIGALTYIIMFIGGIYCVGLAINKGAKDYPISFILWFITTQDALEYSRWYTIAVYIFAVGFFASVVYYFTKIQYRMAMGFLIFLIPFVIYGKESEQMPAVLIILLSVFFVINMIRFNNIRNGDTSIKIGEKNIFQSVLFYVMTFGILASVIPKPNINANRTYLESLINMDAFTDMLISKINVFNNEASSSKFNSLTTNDKILYYAQSDEPLRLKTQVFTDYDYSSDAWTFNYDDYIFSEDYPDTSPSEIIKLIVLCSELDIDFAKKYNISSTSEWSYDAVKKTLTIYPNYANGISAGFLPVPTWLSGVNTVDESVTKSFSNFGTFTEQDQSVNSYKYDVEYYSDSFIYNADVYKILTSLSYDQNQQLYNDMYSVLSQNNKTDDADFINIVITESYNAQNNLDYNDNQKIYQLAMEITDGLSSDYEKALAIEQYFISNDFIYDLTYRKGNDENVETFLFETKRGVCYEYATAMVMLARACGIPARYAEGYNMDETYSSERANSPDYVIRIKDAHGFPELYITGIGWMSFEPTIADYVIDYEKADISKGIYISGIILAVILIIGLLLVKFYPEIYHRFFIFKIRKSNPDYTATLVFLRIRTIFGYGKDVTANELCKNLNSSLQIDISILKNLFEKSSYGKVNLTEDEKKEVINLYLDIYNKFKELKIKK